jgi:hypothetical protein
MLRASLRSSVVIDMAARARPALPISPRRSASRLIRFDLVMIVSGWLNALEHLQHLAGHPQLALQRLVGVGVGADLDVSGRS